MINDLHKGRDTGPVWSVLIDVSAVLMTLHFADGAGLALLSEAQANSRRDRCACSATILAIVLYRLGVP